MEEELKEKKFKIPFQLIFNIVVISLLLINIYLNFSLLSKIQPKSQLQVQNSQTNLQPQTQVSFKNDCNKNLNGYDAVFMYLTTCPHCQKMEPLVEKSSLNWYWINVQDPNCYKLNFTEFKYQGYIPHFYCLKTGSWYTGEMPEEDFENWVRNCST
jgi:hypothetical protein